MSLSRLLVLALACASLACTTAAFADEAAPAGVKGEMLMWMKDAETKLVDLSDAMPVAKYSWRPGKGVRSVGEVYLHVAAANYGIPSFFGVQPPEGFNFQTYEQSMTKKEDIRKALQNSFQHMEKAFTEMTDADMEKPVDLFGTKTTVRGAYLLILSHVHEHLGQSIAYARSNGVVPPWTATQQAAAAQTKA